MCFVLGLVPQTVAILMNLNYQKVRQAFVEYVFCAKHFSKCSLYTIPGMYQVDTIILSSLKMGKH